MENRNNQSLAMPLSVIVAGFMIASAIYVSNTQTGFLKSNNTVDKTAPSQPSPSANDTAPTAQPSNPETAPEEENTGQNTDGTYTVSTDNDPVMGQNNAPVTIILFSDFRCPFCERFATETLPDLKKQYLDTGKAKLVFRDLSIHPPQSDDAAMAAQCANDQGKFWEYHDELFKKLSSGEEFTATTLKAYAGELGLNQGTFDTCFDGGKYKDELTADYSAARAISATGTPTLFIGKSTSNGEIKATKIVGAQPFATFAAEIEKQLK